MRQLDSLRPEVRRDIRWIENDSGGFVAQDPVAGSYFLLSSREHRMACLMNGRRTIDEALQLVQRESSFFGIDQMWIAKLVERMRHAGLLLPNNGPVVAQRARSRGMVQQFLANPLAIRIPVGSLPDFAVTFLRPLANCLFSTSCLALVLLFGFLIGICVLGRWLSAPFSLFADLNRIDAHRAVWLVVALIVVKSLHELGHMLACLRYGLKCPEVGVLFLCFVPCLYCDTTEAWRLKSRWQRIAVSLGGIYFEWIIALMAGAMWLTSQSESERVISGVVFLGCAVGTILINGNPFFRYDGYYALSDFWGKPNLAQRASESAKNHLLYWFAGRLYPVNDDSRPSLSLTSFAIVSSGYRWLVLIGVVWFLWLWLEPLGLGLVAVVIFGLVAMSVVRQAKVTALSTLSEFGSSHPTNVIRLGVVVLVMGTLFLFVGRHPIQPIVLARGYVELAESETIHVPANATLAKCTMDVGTDTIRSWRLSSLELELRYHDNVSQLEVQRLKLNQAEQLQSVDAAYSGEIRIFREVVSELEARVKLLERELDAMKHMIPDDCEFHPARSHPKRRLATKGEVDGTRFTVHSSVEGRVYEKGESLGIIGKHRLYSIRAMVRHEEAIKLSAGDRVRFVWEGAPFREFAGVVTQIPSQSTTGIPKELADDVWTNKKRGQQGNIVSDESHCLIRIEPGDMPDFARCGQLVTVRLTMPDTTMFSWLYEAIAARFRVAH
jgi:putative peptide zinc metalloprotease protein